MSAQFTRLRWLVLLLQSFFTEHMVSHRRAPANRRSTAIETPSGCLTSLHPRTPLARSPQSAVGDLDAPAILSFLNTSSDSARIRPQSRYCGWQRFVHSSGWVACCEIRPVSTWL